MNTAALLNYVAGRNTGDLGDDIALGMDKFCPQYEINTPLRMAHFVSQACHETGGFRYLKEIWGPTQAQKGYDPPSMKAQMLGNTLVGDGRTYCGRGIFQLTGKANYARIGKALNLALIKDPDLACDPQISVQIACHYWMTHQINVPADANDIVRVTKAINGGTNGLEDRKTCFMRARQVLQ